MLGWSGFVIRRVRNMIFLKNIAEQVGGDANLRNPLLASPPTKTLFRTSLICNPDLSLMDFKSTVFNGRDYKSRPAIAVTRYKFSSINKLIIPSTIPTLGTKICLIPAHFITVK